MLMGQWTEGVGKLSLTTGPVMVGTTEGHSETPQNGASPPANRPDATVM